MSRWEKTDNTNCHECISMYVHILSSIYSHFPVSVYSTCCLRAPESLPTHGIGV